MFFCAFAYLEPKKTARRTLVTEAGTASLTAKKLRKNVARKTATAIGRQTPVAALHEIHQYQQSTKLVIPRAPFARLGRGIAADIPSDVRSKPALQEATRDFAAGFLQTGCLCSCGILASRAMHTSQTSHAPV